MVLLLLLHTLEMFVFRDLLGSQQLSVSLYFTIAIVGLNSCSSYYCCSFPVALGEKDVMVTKMLIEGMSALLMLINDCKNANTTSLTVTEIEAKETNTR